MAAVGSTSNTGNLFVNYTKTMEGAFWVGHTIKKLSELPKEFVAVSEEAAKHLKAVAALCSMTAVYYLVWLVEKSWDILSKGVQNPIHLVDAANAKTLLDTAKTGLAVASTFNPALLSVSKVPGLVSDVIGLGLSGCEVLKLHNQGNPAPSRWPKYEAIAKLAKTILSLTGLILGCFFASSSRRGQAVIGLLAPTCAVAAGLFKQMQKRQALSTHSHEH